MVLYNETVMDHFSVSRNEAGILGSDGIGMVGNPYLHEAYTIEEFKDKNDFFIINKNYGTNRPLLLKGLFLYLIIPKKE